jgi:hypothetical protein
MRERRLAEKAVGCRFDAICLACGRFGFVQFHRIAHIHSAIKHFYIRLIGERI